MSTSPPRPSPRPPPGWTDEQLVAACRDGSAEAWSALVDKYKNLVYSIAVDYGLAPESRADVFQEVWLDLLTDLPRLREPRALPAWLMRVASHKCFRRRRQERQYLPLDGRAARDGSNDGARASILTAARNREPVPLPDERLRQIEQEQGFREVLSLLSPRCRQLVDMLFFENPPRPYREVARQLGLAVGSIGFIRGRCLEKLRQALRERGLA